MILDDLETYSQLEAEKAMRIIYLETSSYAGYALGAEHYYGTLHNPELEYNNPDRITEVTRAITKAEADVINQNRITEVPYKARKGDTTTGFYSESAVIAAALSVWAKKFDDGHTLLVLGDHVVASPQIALCGPEPYKTQINDYVQAYERAEAMRDGGARDSISDEFWEWRCGGFKITEEGSDD